MKKSISLAGALSILTIVSSPSVACFFNNGKTKVLLTKPPVDIQMVNDVAKVRVTKILDINFSEASVVERRKGFHGVATFIIINGRGGGTCDNGPRDYDIGKPLFVAGTLKARPKRRPVFWGIWSDERFDPSYSPMERLYPVAPL